MRKTIVLTLLSAASASGMPRLDALSMIESADNDTAVGTAGEVSRFQIKPSVWRHYSPNPHYRNSALARVVAGRFLSDLEADFRRRARREPTDFDRYVLWNAGPNYYARINYSKARVNRVIRERAIRFANLCQIPSNDSSATGKLSAARPGIPTPKREMPRQDGPTAAAQVFSFSLERSSAQMEFPAFALSTNMVPGIAHPVATGRPTVASQGILALGALNRD